MTMRTICALLIRGLLATGLLTVAHLAHAGHYVFGNYTNAYGSRNYELWVPSGYVAGQHIPLIVALHGCGQTPLQFAGLTRLNALADAQKVLVVYPMQSPLANPSGCWNWFRSSNQLRGAGEPSLIKGIVDRVKASYSVNNARVYVGGLSAGGFMTSIMMACYSDVFAAAMVASAGMYKAATNPGEAALVGVSGSPHDPDTRGLHAWNCSGSPSPRPTPVIVFHGEDDTVVAPVNAQQAIAQFAQTNDFTDDRADNNTVRATATSVTGGIAPGGLSYTRRDYVYGRILLQYYTVAGMGHAWSGGNPAFFGAEPDGPDETSIMWSFFTQHTR